MIAIYDANGEKQVEYAYDAWGNCEVIYIPKLIRFCTPKQSPSKVENFTLLGDFVNFGQLIRENNEALDKTYVYEYNGISFDSSSIIGGGAYYCNDNHEIIVAKISKINIFLKK